MKTSEILAIAALAALGLGGLSFIVKHTSLGSLLIYIGMILMAVGALLRNENFECCATDGSVVRGPNVCGRAPEDTKCGRPVVNGVFPGTCKTGCGGSPRPSSSSTFCTKNGFKEFDHQDCLVSGGVQSCVNNSTGTVINNLPNACEKCTGTCCCV